MFHHHWKQISVILPLTSWNVPHTSIGIIFCRAVILCYFLPSAVSLHMLITSCSSGPGIVFTLRVCVIVTKCGPVDANNRGNYHKSLLPAVYICLTELSQLGKIQLQKWRKVPVGVIVVCWSCSAIRGEESEPVASGVWRSAVTLLSCLVADPNLAVMEELAPLRCSKCPRWVEAMQHVVQPHVDCIIIRRRKGGRKRTKGLSLYTRGLILVLMPLKDGR